MKVKNTTAANGKDFDSDITILDDEGNYVMRISQCEGKNEFWVGVNYDYAVQASVKGHILERFILKVRQND
jgi:hypothetical protein